MLLPMLTACALAVSAAPAKPKPEPAKFSVSANGGQVAVKVEVLKATYTATADHVSFDETTKELIFQAAPNTQVTVTGSGRFADVFTADIVKVNLSDGTVRATNRASGVLMPK